MRELRRIVREPALDGSTSLPGDHLEARPMPKPPRPMMAATPPTIKSHRVLSVGSPLNKREKSELMESEAITPRTMRTVPTTTSARKKHLAHGRVYRMHHPRMALRPLRTLTRIMTTATTSNTWTKPPMVYEETSPSNQRMIKTTAMV
jgi:hypothetical protein